MRTIPRVAVAAAGVVTAGLLAGCGVADEGVRPGVAAEVGGTTIRVADVEAAADDRCEVIDEIAGEGDQPISGARIRDIVFQAAVLREVAAQLAEEYGVGTGEYYENAQEEIRRQLEGVDEDLVDRVLPSVTSRPYFDDILIQVGREDLGITESDDPGGQQGHVRGLEIAQAWQDEHPVETNPRYAAPVISAADGGVLVNRRDLSYAVSDFAKDALGAAEDPQAEDPAYAASLPDSQRCGGG